jgi:hypothetical protein
MRPQSLESDENPSIYSDTLQTKCPTVHIPLRIYIYICPASIIYILHRLFRFISIWPIRPEL